jgi:hypothetical protein
LCTACRTPGWRHALSSLHTKGIVMLAAIDFGDFCFLGMIGCALLILRWRNS